MGLVTVLEHPAMLGFVATIDGHSLEERRRALHWTQEKLAQRARVSTRTVQSAETGRVSEKSFARIVAALETGAEEKVRDDEPELATVTYTVEGTNGPIKVVVTARKDVVARLDFTALVAHALGGDQS